MTLHEPATFATDCALAAWSLWLGSRLNLSSPAARWWRRTFFWTAGAGLAGGIYHGFKPAMPMMAADVLWRATLLSLGVTSLCLTLAVAHMALPETSVRFWQCVAWVKAILCAGVAMAHPVFLSAIADYGSAMLFALVVELHAWRATGASHARWIVAGILVSALAAGVQQAGWDPSPHFNHNDLYHVIQLFALALLYRGARTLR